MTDVRLSRQDRIRAILTQALSPERLEIVDDSHRHASHYVARPGEAAGETHFTIRIVAAVFAGKSRVERHRLVNGLLGPLFDEGLHALALKAAAPGEPGA